MLPPDDAYTCGLLHYIGKTLLDRLGGKDYKHVEEMVLFGIKDYKAEEAVYGCNHMQVAIAAVRKWGLAEVLTSGLDYAHAAEEEDPARAYRACTALATQIARMAMEGSQSAKDEVLHLLPAWAMETLGIPEEKAGTIIDGGSAAISAWKVAI